jgi:ankyrin repeat protein
MWGRLGRITLGRGGKVDQPAKQFVGSFAALRLRPLAFGILATGIGLVSATSATFAGELHDAVRAEDKAAVEALLAGGAEVDGSDFIFGTALHVAVSEGSTEIAKTLIDHGADVEAVSEQQGARPMHLAAQFGDPAMLALLLDRGADIEAHDGLQRTPLLRAAPAGHAAAVRLLLDRGAEVHAREGRYGETPLHEASFQGRLDVVKLLLDHGADISATDNAGRTAFGYAATVPSYTGVGDSSLLEYLVAKGADPNAKDSSGISALVNVKNHAGDPWREIEDVLRRLGATE